MKYSIKKRKNSNKFIIKRKVKRTKNRHIRKTKGSFKKKVERVLKRTSEKKFND